MYWFGSLLACQISWDEYGQWKRIAYIWWRPILRKYLNVRLEGLSKTRKIPIRQSVLRLRNNPGTPKTCHMRYGYANPIEIWIEKNHWWDNHARNRLNKCCLISFLRDMRIVRTSAKTLTAVPLYLVPNWHERMSYRKKRTLNNTIML